MSIYKNGWSRQSVLDQIEKVNKFIKCEDKRNGLCFYRHPDNNSKTKACFVGVFIPDNYIHLSDIIKRNYSANDLFRIYPDLLKFMPMDNNRMIEFQRFHDRNNYHSRELIENFLIKLEHNRNEEKNEKN